MVDFGVRLKELRKAASKTQKALAAAAGITPDALFKLESGARKPTWETAVALAAALGVGVEAFQQPPAAAPVVKPGRPKKAAGKRKGKG